MNKAQAEMDAHVWAMEPRALSAMLETVGSLADCHYEANAAAMNAFGHTDAEGGTRLQVEDGVATIPIRGIIMGSIPWFFRFFGIEATSTAEARALVAEAAADERVDSIVLDVDSPGGAVDGLAELADEVSATDKPTVAQVGARANSAAFWIAAQADAIEAGPTSVVGSIGVFSVLHDTSAAHEAAGVKVHVISSHELKGAGVEGSEVTDAQLEDVQRNVDTLASLFRDAVARGRGMKPAAVRKLATGQVWIGQEAVDNGLIDSIRDTTTATQTIAEPEPDEEDLDDIEPDESTTSASTDARTITMTELETLRAQLAEAEVAKVAAETQAAKMAAKNEATEASLAEVHAQRRTAIIEAHRDRVTPAMLPSVEKFAAACGNDHDELEAFLKTLPVQIRTDQEGGLSEHIDQIAAAHAIGNDAGGKKLRAQFGITRKTEKFLEVRAAHADGTFTLVNGDRVTRDELTN